MRTELIDLTEYTTASNPIILDDYSNRSFAVYCAINRSNKAFFYYMPDEARGSDPRCDYLLVGNEDCSVRFIELKGADIQSGIDCCKNTWGHAFHQLIATYNAYAGLINSEEDTVKMILCTSVYRYKDGRKRSATRYEQYRYYKKIRELGVVPQILFSDDEDVV